MTKTNQWRKTTIQLSVVLRNCYTPGKEQSYLASERILQRFHRKADVWPRLCIWGGISQWGLEDRVFPAWEEKFRVWKCQKLVNIVHQPVGYRASCILTSPGACWICGISGFTLDLWIRTCIWAASSGNSSAQFAVVARGCISRVEYMRWVLEQGQCL